MVGVANSRLHVIRPGGEAHGVEANLVDPVIQIALTLLEWLDNAECSKSRQGS
jgi:hypothetical protein